MPELPEVETALRGVTPYLKDFTIEKIVVRQAPITLGCLSWINHAQKRQILDTSRRAKYLIIHTEKRLHYWSF